MPRVPTPRVLKIAVMLLCVALGAVLPAGAQGPEPRDPKLEQGQPAPVRPPRVIRSERLGPDAVRTKLVLAAAQDAYISSNFPGERLGRGEYLYLGYDASAPAFGAQRILLEFNLPESTIPPGAVIDSAYLQLYMVQALPSNDAPMTTHFRLLGTDWDQATVTWPGPSWASGPIPGISLDTTPGWKNWDVTDIVEDWVDDRDDNHGLELFGEEEAFQQEREFVATENNEPGHSSLYPRLEVEFTAAADSLPPTSTIQALPAYSPSTFTLTWTGRDQGPSGISYYDVQVRPSGSDWRDLLSRQTVTSTQFTGENGVRYDFRVRAVDKAGNAEAYGDVEAGTTVDAVAPVSNVNPPTGSSWARANHVVTWAGSDNLSGIKWYDVDYIREGDSNWTRWQSRVPGTSATYTPPSEGPVWFRVSATDNAGNVEVAGGPEAAWVFDLTAPSAMVSALPASSPQTFQVNWSGTDNRSGVRSYNVDVRRDGGEWTRWLSDQVATGATYTAPAPGVYAFRVQATDNAGNVEVAGGAEAQTTVQFGAPTARVITVRAVTSDTLEVTWQGSTNPGTPPIQFYDVQYRINGGAWTPWISRSTATSATLNVTVDGVYEFEARAIDTAGNTEPYTGQAEAIILVDRAPPFVVPQTRLPLILHLLPNNPYPLADEQ